MFFFGLKKSGSCRPDVFKPASGKASYYMPLAMEALERRLE